MQDVPWFKRDPAENIFGGATSPREEVSVVEEFINPTFEINETRTVSGFLKEWSETLKSHQPSDNLIYPVGPSEGHVDVSDLTDRTYTIDFGVVPAQAKETT